MKAGFTGTREQPTMAQRAAFRRWISENKPDELHHGGCIGADVVAATVGACQTKKCVCHPPNNDILVSDYAVGVSDEKRPSLGYLERNQAIVNACDVLLAMPKGPEEQRSGTWSTIRYGRKQRKPIVIFWPDGRVTAEDEISNLQPAQGK